MAADPAVTGVPTGATAAPLGEKEEWILDAVIAVLSRGGITAVSMRAVATEAGVALGLVNYYFDSKTSLIAAALHRLGQEDAQLVAQVAGLDPVEQLRHALRRVADEEFLRPNYLGLRLHLWSLAPIEPAYARINNEAQIRYRDGLAALIAAARPGLHADDVAHRAADILVIQNGMWLTSILIVDRESIARSVERCEAIAFATHHGRAS